MTKLQIFDSSLFIGQIYFNNDGEQLYLIFQPIYKTITTFSDMCYYFDDIIEYVDIYFSDILLDQKLYQNVSVYDISYKTSTRPEPLRIRFDKISGFIRVHDDKFRL